jgi:hypothetical protein
MRRRDEDMMKVASTKIVFDYWDGLRGQRAAPERAEIEPGAMRHALADAFMLENDAGRLTFRLAGSRLCALAGRDLKGQPLSSLWATPALASDMERLGRSVMDESAGAIAGLIGETDDGRSLNAEFLLLPLRHLGRTHARLMGSLAPQVAPPWLGDAPVRMTRLISVRMMWPDGFLRALPGAQARRSQFVVIEGGLR